MHKIGEKVVYGSHGVMEIVDIKEESVGDVLRKYYVLRELDSVYMSQTYVPVDNEKLVCAMRPLLTKKEIMTIISKISTLEGIEWQRDNRLRSEKFRSIIESGDREGMLALIKTVYENGMKRNEEGKKNYLTDESFMRKAERLVFSEFAAVLGIKAAEVPEFIEKNL